VHWLNPSDLRVYALQSGSRDALRVTRFEKALA
jgi:hypothetical protein